MIPSGAFSRSLYSVAVANAPDQPDDELSSHLYAELRGRARQLMAGERADHTLSATALVHEAYVKLGSQPFVNSKHFFVAAGNAMRQILIDHARGRATLKRGEGKKLDLSNIADAWQLARADRCEEILILDEAISRLEQQDGRAAEVVRMRFFAGLGMAEIAATLGVSPATAKRDWRIARATLYQLLRSSDQGNDI